MTFHLGPKHEMTLIYIANVAQHPICRSRITPPPIWIGPMCMVGCGDMMLDMIYECALVIDVFFGSTGHMHTLTIFQLPDGCVNGVVNLCMILRKPCHIDS